MIRTFEQKEVEDLAKYGSIPVINGLTDYAHPCQVLADLMTIREYKGSFKGLKMAFVGDGNNMANSLIVGAIKTGMSFAIACPKGYEPDAEIMKWAKENGDFTLTTDVKEAVKDADGARLAYRRDFRRRRRIYGRMGVDGSGGRKAEARKGFCFVSGK